jgi:hypothetical protein
MATDFKIDWGSAPTDLTVTNLASLADGNIWQTGALDPGGPSPEIVRVSYEIVFNATPVAGDSLQFFFASGDEAASNEVWNGGIGTGEGQITTAAAKAAAEAGCDMVHQHAWQTSHGTNFKGSFDVANPGPSWQLLVKAAGEALAPSGHRVRIRYGTTQSQ